MLRVAGSYDSERLPSIVEFDFYTPITFETQEVLRGCHYVQLGNSHTSLLELRVPTDSMLVWGFTVTLVDKTHKTMLSGSPTISQGLPIIELPSGAEFAGREGARYVKLPIDFSILVSETCAEVRLDAAKTFDRVLAHGNVWFMLLGDQLVGLRIPYSREDDRNILIEYLRRCTIRPVKRS